MLLLLSGVFYYGQAQAQTVSPPTGLQISPVRFDWDMNSGEERTGVINLKNYDNVPRDVSIAVQDFYVTDTTTEARFFVPDQSSPLYAYDVINWIQYPQSLTLAPGEGRDVSFHVAVPSETPTGGYYGVIFFKSQMSGGDGSTSQIGINQQIGSLLVMAVKGSQPITRTGQITGFSALRKIFWDGPAQLVANMYNSGNLHYKMLGAIDIYKFGSKIESIPLNPQLEYPGKTREYQQDWNFSSWAYGYYTAKLTLVSDDGAIQLAAQTSFWIIPWKTTVSIIILLVIIYLVFKLLGSKFEIRKKETNRDE